MISKYTKLSLLPVDEEEAQVISSHGQESWSTRSFGFRFLIGLLFLSASINVLYAAGASRDLCPLLKSDYASLAWTVDATFKHDVYSSHNETQANEAWNQLNVNHGAVAIDDEEAATLGLPFREAQRFPWDGSKGLYYINGYHGVHCLKVIRETLLQLRDGLPLSSALGHSLHCLASLRQDIMCNADDSPRYSSVNGPSEMGLGQHRTCRNWTRLEQWAKDRTACWRDINPNEKIETLLKYRYCPPDSPYNGLIREIFGNFSTGDDASAST